MSTLITAATGVVLQGGGALGAFEYGVLRALHELRPGFRPHTISGISIGAITAAIYGGAKHDDPIGALDELWRRRLVTLPGMAVFGNPGMYAPDPWSFVAPAFTTSIYETTPLQRTLEALIDPDRLNDDDPHVTVGAINIQSGQMEWFDNRQPGGLGVEHVMASGALPPGFPAVKIGGRSYWDGGLFSNLPLAPVINELEAAEGGDRGVRRELIVVELFGMSGRVPTDMHSVLSRMGELQYTSRLALDEQHFASVDAMVAMVERLDAALAANDPIRDDPTFQKMLAHRRIDEYTVITANLPARWAKADDFSRAAIEYRIDAGYAAAMEQMS